MNKDEKAWKEFQEFVREEFSDSYFLDPKVEYFWKDKSECKIGELISWLEKMREKYGEDTEVEFHRAPYTSSAGIILYEHLYEHLIEK